MSGSLDGSRDHSLMKGTIPGDPSRDNFTTFIGESLKESVIKIADGVHIIFAKPASTPSFSFKFCHNIIFQS